MAGVYTDNQPDFSFLQPGETKTWTQCWYPIQKIGSADHANADAAVRFRIDKRKATLGVCVSGEFPNAKVTLSKKNATISEFARDLMPGVPLLEEIELPERVGATDLVLTVQDASGGEILCYRPKAKTRGEVPPPATEPSPPEEIASTDELFITGMHLEQYRHATRCPTDYWREAIRRDPLDSRSNNAMGRWHMRRGEFEQAETHFRNAIERLTLRNPNPHDGEPFYNLGLCLRYRLDALPAESIDSSETIFSAAYAAFYKATWNQAWAAAGYHALAEMDCRRGDWNHALQHLNLSLRFDTDNLRARDLKAVVLQKLGEIKAADELLAETLALDPLDWWAIGLSGQPLACDAQTMLDLVHDYARAGLYADAISLLSGTSTDDGTDPLVDYAHGWLYERLGDGKSALDNYQKAAARSPDYCFPARLEEIAVLGSAMQANPRDSHAPYYLGNLLYDRRRHAEAIQCWEQSVKIDPSYSVAWRNLGIGYFNVLKQQAKAKRAFERAFRAESTSARLLFERDQLWKRMAETPGIRLRELEKHLELVRQRDDLCVELGALYNQTGHYEKTLALLAERNFQPWEGGEGQALAVYVRARLALGRGSLEHGDAATARVHFEAALTPPCNLGEAKHLLANQSDIHFWLGCALAELGEKSAAKSHWLSAADFRGDFQAMSACVFSEMTYYSALAMERLGRKAKSRALLGELLDYAKRLEKTPAKIPFFATSLPAMLLFEDDIQFRQATTALFLQAQARLGLGQKAKSRKLAQTVLARDPNHPLAADFA
jgi:tetratricopeptide (TPR) repeat protein